MVHAYLHIHKPGTTLENQRAIIQEYASQNGLSVENWIVDSAIRRFKDYDVSEFDTLFKDIKEGDILIFYDLTFIGYHILIITDFLIFCMRKKVQVWTISDNRKLGVNNDFELLASGLQLCANLGRAQIDEEGLGSGPLFS